jgi:hypothetical protein
MLSPEQKLIYETISESVRKRPVLDGKCDHKTFQGIQNYKSALGFPTLPESCLQPLRKK